MLFVFVCYLALHIAREQVGAETEQEEHEQASGIEQEGEADENHCHVTVLG